MPLTTVYNTENQISWELDYQETEREIQQYENRIIEIQALNIPLNDDLDSISQSILSAKKEFHTLAAQEQGNFKSEEYYDPSFDRRGLRDNIGYVNNARDYHYGNGCMRAVNNEPLSKEISELLGKLGVLNRRKSQIMDEILPLMNEEKRIKELLTQLNTKKTKLEQHISGSLAFLNALETDPEQLVIALKKNC